MTRKSRDTGKLAVVANVVFWFSLSEFVFYFVLFFVICSLEL